MNTRLETITQKASASLSKLNRYKVVLIIVAIGLLYGFMLVRISQLSSAQPSESMILEKSKTIKTTRVDSSVVSQLQRLQDNSVSVKALFDNARSNPFQE